MALVLTDSGEKLEIVATIVIPFTVHYADYVGATPVFTPGIAAGDTLNGTKDLLAAPVSGQRVVRTISVHNDSGAADTITIQLDDGGVNYTITTIALPDGYTLCYDEDGWHVLDGDGAIGTTLFTHAILGPHHSDAATDAVSQGSLIFGNATPAWDELVHPGVANRVLQSSAAEVAWSANAVTFPTAGAVPIGSGANTQVAYWTAANTLAGDAGLTYNAATDTITIAGDILMADDHFVGITGDIRIEFDQTDGDIMFHLGDAAGVDEVQVVDSGSGVVAYIDSDGTAYFAGNVGIGIDGPASILHTYSTTIDSPTLITMRDGFTTGNVVGDGPGIKFNKHITGGQLNSSLAAIVSGIASAAEYSLGFRVGAWNNNDTPGTDDMTIMGNGNVGIGITAPKKRLHVNSGTVNTVFRGQSTDPDVVFEMMDDTSHAITPPNFGAVGNNAFFGRGASKYLYIQDGGKIGIGTTGPLAQLHVDQSGASGAIPVLLLDQADLSEEFIELTATVGAGNPLDTAAIGTYYGKMRVNVTGVGYKYIALYNS